MVTYQVHGQGRLNHYLNTQFTVVHRKFGAIENRFGDDTVIFRMRMHLAIEGITVFLQKKNISSMTWSANSLDINPNENLWWKWKNKLIHDKAPSCIADLSTAFHGSLNQLDECSAITESLFCAISVIFYKVRNLGKHPLSLLLQIGWAPPVTTFYSIGLLHPWPPKIKRGKTGITNYKMHTQKAKTY